MFSVSPPGLASRTYARLRPTVHYWMETEVHVYGFSIAANVLLSFFPFLIVMVSLCRYVFHWQGAEQAVYLALADYFPGELGEFIQRNLRATIWRRGPFQFASVLLLLFTANGIFEPLEVALNRVWGAHHHRSFLKNQLVSQGLIFACGALVMASTVLTATNQSYFGQLLGPKAKTATLLSLVFFKIAAVPITILVLFLIYWLLPNLKVPWRLVVAPSIIVGLLLEVLKYMNLLTWPWLRAKVNNEYGPFGYSVVVILWSFIAAMLVLAGAEWAARHRQIAAPGGSQIDFREESRPYGPQEADRDVPRSSKRKHSTHSS